MLSPASVLWEFRVPPAAHNWKRQDKVQNGEFTVVSGLSGYPNNKRGKSGTGCPQYLFLQASVSQAERGKAESWKGRTGLTQSEYQEYTEGLEET